MADLTLASRSALQGLATQGRHGNATDPAGVTIREIQNIQIAHVIARKGRSGDVAKILSMLAGADVADVPARFSATTIAATGIGLGQWRVTRRAQPGANLAGELTDRLTGIAAVIDQSHSCFVLEVSGVNARDALAKGIPVDLDQTVFKSGSAAQTAASHITLQIATLDGAPTFEIIAAASTAGSFWSWLISSAAEYGIDVVAHA